MSKKVFHTFFLEVKDPTNYPFVFFYKFVAKWHLHDTGLGKLSSACFSH